MHTEHGAEGAELEPAREELLILGIGRIAIARRAVAEEAAGIGVPVRNAGQREVQSSGNLIAKNLPGRLNIARPGDRAVALLARIGRTGEDDDALLVRGGTLPLVDAA